MQEAVGGNAVSILQLGQKVDNSKGQPSILVEKIKDEVHADERHINALREAMNQDSIQRQRSGTNPVPQPTAPKSGHKNETAAKPAVPPKSAPAVEQKAASKPAPRGEIPNDYVPPEPDIPPAYNIWYGDEQVVPVKEKPQPQVEKPRQNLSDRLLAEADKEYQPKAESPSKTALQPKQEKAPVAAAPVEEPPESEVQTAVPVVEEAAAVEVNTKEPAPILPPVSPPEPNADPRKKVNPQMVTVVLRSLGDKERDILRMRRVYGLLISEPGPDRFAFYVIEHSRGYRLEFPSDSTALTKQLERKLEELVGPENVIIEPITIQ